MSYSFGSSSLKSMFDCSSCGTLFALFFFGDLPEPSSLSMCLLLSLHDEVMELLFSVLVLVCVFFVGVFSFSFVWVFKLNDHFLEFLWTLFPLAVLFFFSFPSILAIFSMEDFSSASSFCFVKGLQWDWEVCYSTVFSSGFDCDSYSLMSFFQTSLDYRLLETFNSVCVTIINPVVFCVSSEDVVHSFTVPSLGFKLDCVPGKSSEILSSFLQCGIFHGHCAEICGSGHSSMPMEVFSFVSFYGGSSTECLLWGWKVFFSS